MFLDVQNDCEEEEVVLYLQSEYLVDEMPQLVLKPSKVVLFRQRIQERIQTKANERLGPTPENDFRFSKLSPKPPSVYHVLRALPYLHRLEGILIHKPLVEPVASVSFKQDRTTGWYHLHFYNLPRWDQSLECLDFVLVEDHNIPVEHEVYS